MSRGFDLGVGGGYGSHGKLESRVASHFSTSTHTMLGYLKSRRS